MDGLKTLLSIVKINVKAVFGHLKEITKNHTKLKKSKYQVN